MQRKTVFYAEAAFVLGIIILAFGVAFMEKADFGMSMVVVPAYLIHLKVSQFLPLCWARMSRRIVMNPYRVRSARVT